MPNRENSNSRGVSVIEIAMVLLVIGITIAMATPLITNAMREYRLSTAEQDILVMLHRAKTTAVSNNGSTAVVVDTANSRIGLATAFIGNGNGTVTTWVNLPSGVSFATPSGVTAPVAGAPTTSAISFPLQASSSTAYQQNFTSLGLPSVATAGAVNAIYLTNGRSYIAITLTCVSGLGVWGWSSTTNTWTKE